MPGPKMGARPPDFDEELVRRSPTFRRWMELATGQKLKYACREFIKDRAGDEERLMRRIMIARRNNVRDHQALKKAREIKKIKETLIEPATTATATNKPEPLNNSKEELSLTTETSEDGNKRIGSKSVKSEDDNTNQSQMTGNEPRGNGTLEAPVRRRRPSTFLSDAQVAEEMDVPAVKATRSYRAWSRLPDGAEFLYNQKYIKGREGHDWLLRKNIWRRMRYRRENKKMVEEMLCQRQRRKEEAAATMTTNTDNAVDMVSGNHGVSTASHIVDQALLSTTPGLMAGIDRNSQHHFHNPHHQEQHHHHHPTDSSTVNHQHGPQNDTESAVAVAASIIEESNAISHDADAAAAVEAAVAAAESYAISTYSIVHNPLEATTTPNTDAGLGLALDAAARLAAASSAGDSNLGTDDAAVLAAVAHHKPPPVGPIAPPPPRPGSEVGPDEIDYITMSHTNG